MAHVTTISNQLKRCFVESKAEEIHETLKIIEQAWYQYNGAYESYILINVSVQELEHVENRQFQNQRVHVRHPARNGLKPSGKQVKLSPIMLTRSKSSCSSRSAKLKEKRNIELKKLMGEQAQELANYEAEIEKRKIDIEMQKQKAAREAKSQAHIAEKEAHLFAEEESDEVSSIGSQKGELEHISLQPPS